MPRETRDLIYEYTLALDADPPLSPEHCGPRKPLLWHRSKESLRDMLWDQEYEPAIQIPTTSPPVVMVYAGFLLCSKQIRNEMQEAAGRHNYLLKRRCKLDIMVDKETSYPTWLTYPANLTRCSLVEVDIRYFPQTNHRPLAAQGRVIKPSVNRETSPGDARQRGKYLPRVWRALLERFVYGCDAQWSLESYSARNHRTIHHLVINARTPSVTEDPRNLILQWMGSPTAQYYQQNLGSALISSSPSLFTTTAKLPYFQTSFKQDLRDTLDKAVPHWTTDLWRLFSTAVRFVWVQLDDQDEQAVVLNRPLGWQKVLAKKSPNPQSWQELQELKTELEVFSRSLGRKTREHLECQKIIEHLGRI
ncbi:MAG: hypothetical protein M1820_001886 [Bogoriella megaspora]|nr:MAG: hypothetical protein M1820_001886 [Bogoriella megaspora]